MARLAPGKPEVSKVLSFFPALMNLCGTLILFRIGDDLAAGVARCLHRADMSLAFSYIWRYTYRRRL